MKTKKANWLFPPTKEEKESVIKYIEGMHNLYLELVKDINDNKNRFIMNYFYGDIRRVSEHTGLWNNLSISKDALKLFGKTYSRKYDYLVRKKGKGIIVEHVRTVKTLFEEFLKEKFDPKKWFESCHIAYITKEENLKMENEEKRLRKLYKRSNDQQIHDEAYKNMGLTKNLIKIENEVI